MSKVPLANEGGGIASLVSQDLSNGCFVLREATRLGRREEDAIRRMTGGHSTADGESSCEEASARGCTDGRGGISVLQDLTLLGDETVDVWGGPATVCPEGEGFVWVRGVLSGGCFQLGKAESHVAVSEVICQKHDDVGSGSCLCERAGKEDEKPNEREER